MATAKISDAEAHELVLKRINSRTREEWQAKIDEVNAIFDRVEAEDRALTASSVHTKSTKPSKTSASKSRQAAAV